MTRLRKFIFGFGVAAFLPSAVLAGGATCSVNDGIWQAGHSGAQTSLNTAVNTMAATIATQSQLTNEQLISAVRIATRQRSAASGREAAFGKSAAQGVAQVYASQQAAERIAEAHRTYGPQGQAVGSCDIIERLQQTDVALTTLGSRASEIMSSGALYSAPGSTVEPGEAVAAALRFDTPEAVSAEAFLSPDTPDALKDAFMNNVIGFPPVKPQSITGPGDRMTMMMARRAEAVRSPAIVSLAAVRAAREEGGHFDDASGMSADEALSWLISRYGGGDEYEEWSAALVTKSEVGLAKEIARLRAIALGLENSLSGSNDRREAVIAALLGAEAVR